MVIDAVCEVSGAEMMVPAEVMSHHEADHRVANSLHLVSALLGFQARQSVNPEVRDALAAAINRIFAVAGIHRQLCQSDSSDVVDIASYFVDLASALEQGCGGGVAQKRVLVHVKRQMVPAAFASAMGIVITELVMNACKHAYGPDEPGTVEVRIFFPTPTDFQMEVRDYGGPTALRPPVCPGIGTRIIDVMSRKLNAVYAYVPDEEGTRFLMQGAVASRHS